MLKQRFYRYCRIFLCPAVVIFALILSLTSSSRFYEQIDIQLFNERSENMLNTTNKIADLMNAKIKATWNTLDTAAALLETFTEITEPADPEALCRYIQSVSCPVRNSGNQDFFLLID